MNANLLQAIVPECVLVAAAVGIYMAGAFVTARRGFAQAALIAIVASAAALSFARSSPATTSLAAAGSPLVLDGLAHYGRWLALTAGFLLMLIAQRPVGPIGAAEYVASLLLAIAGAMLAVSANDLVLLFVGLELISIPTYVMLYLGRRDAASQEAAAKYFYLSIIASAVLLYGFSFLYGIGGSTSLAAVRHALGPEGRLPAGFDRFARLALVLVFGGLGFRITAAPMHFYAPDVYQGTSHANAAFLAVVAKIAGFVVLARLLALVMSGPALGGWRIAMALAVLSMCLGNFLALWQENLRRLLAYSSIAHSGYMLIGLAVALVAPRNDAWSGFAALLFYLAAYAAATIGVFAALAYLGREEQPVDNVEELAGLGKTRPYAAGLLAVGLFSLAGIPPLAGFWGKLLLFGGALNVGGEAAAAQPIDPSFLTLAIIGVLNAAVAAGYYLRVIAVMYFRTPLATPRAEGGQGAFVAAALAALAVLGIGFYPGPLMRAAQVAGAVPLAERSIGQQGDANSVSSNSVPADSVPAFGGMEGSAAAGTTIHGTPDTAAAESLNTQDGTGAPPATAPVAAPVSGP